MSEERTGGLGLGVIVLAVGGPLLCCGGPLLFGAGGAALLGGALRSWPALALAALLVVAAVIYAFARVRRSRTARARVRAEGAAMAENGSRPPLFAADDCCAPRPQAAATPARVDGTGKDAA